MLNVVLVHSPLVGPSSLRPTARALEATGVLTHVPSPAGLPARLPAWRDWPQLLLASLPGLDDAIVVGHSAGGLLAAWLAGRLDALGMICLDAAIPPATGPTPPAEPDFLEFVQSLPHENGVLFPWSHWWGGDVLENAPVTPQLKSTFASELPRIPLGWFDDRFDMSDWSRCARGFIQTSPVFDRARGRRGRARLECSQNPGHPPPPDVRTRRNRRLHSRRLPIVRGHSITGRSAGPHPRGAVGHPPTPD